MKESAKTVQALFINDYFRVYTNKDILGIEIGAVLKNIYCRVDSGAISGMGFKRDNAKAALVTRGLAEITRLDIAMVADPLTFLWD